MTLRAVSVESKEQERTWVKLKERILNSMFNKLRQRRKMRQQ